MPRGRYALRARTKADADARYSAARQEADQLRARLTEIRALRAQIETLTKEVDLLRSQLAKKTTPELDQLRKVAADFKAWKEKNRIGYQKYQEAMFGAIDEMLDFLEVPRYSRQRKRAAEPILRAVTREGKGWMKLGLPPNAVDALVYKDALSG